MILRMKKFGKRKVALVYCEATDWCVWPVLVFNPAVPVKANEDIPLLTQFGAVLLSIQWLNRAVGVSWFMKRPQKKE